MRLFFIFLFLFFSVDTLAQNFSVLTSSSAKKTGQLNRFSARVCLEDVAGTYQLAHKQAIIGVMHAYPNTSNESRVYRFEVSESGQEKTHSATTDSSGCLVISDTIEFGQYDTLPKTSRRGQTIDQHDPIAERTYGLKFDGVPALIVTHIVFNRGISTGRIQIEVLK